jgi:hypothetical protein
MTHPCLVSGPLPTDIRSSLDFRLTPVQLIGDRKIGSRERRFLSVTVVHTCRNIAKKPSEGHPSQQQSDPVTKSAPDLTSI